MPIGRQVWFRLHQRNLSFWTARVIQTKGLINFYFTNAIQSASTAHFLNTTHLTRNFTSATHNQQPCPIGNSIEQLRNIGIVAHIDAGKTTTTERMLHYSGYINNMGEVHDGTTVMDHLRQERERGITITSAAITFPWNGYQINLIDTPGHVDFSIEVDRSLSILDGAVVVVDGSIGVQAQTENIWKQLDNFKIPRIIFVNKMDKEGSSVEQCMSTLRLLLHSNSFPINIPIYEKSGQKLDCIFDLVNCELVHFSGRNGIEVEKRQVVQSMIPAKLLKHRERLVENLAELDEEFMNEFLDIGSTERISGKSIERTIAKLTKQLVIVPVLFGSAYKNFGIQLLMDAVCNYLPHPISTATKLSCDSVATVFKVVYDSKKGVLAYVKINCGRIYTKDTLWNAATKQKERISKLFVPYADQLEEVVTLSAGAVGVLTGLAGIKTGHLLVSNQKDIKQYSNQFKSYNPVFIQALEPDSPTDEKYLLECLNRIAIEDPSFQFTNEQETNQIVIKGMGELHLEVVVEKLLKELNVKASVGPIRIAHREQLVEGFEESCEFYDQGIVEKFRFTISTADNTTIETNESNLQVHSGLSSEEVISTAEEAIQFACKRGAIEGFPMHNVKIKISSLKLKDSVSKDVLFDEIYSLFSKYFSKLAVDNKIVVTEPYCQLDLTIPTKFSGQVIRDITNVNQRNGQILAVENSNVLNQELTVIRALLPVKNTIGYSRFIRSLTAGKAEFSFQPANFFPVAVTRGSKSGE